MPAHRGENLSKHLDMLWQHIAAQLVPLLSHYIGTFSLIGIHLAHPHQVHTWSFVHLIDSIDNQDMHQVVWVEEQIQSSREPPFWNVGHSHKGSCYCNGILLKSVFIKGQLEKRFDEAVNDERHILDRKIHI